MRLMTQDYRSENSSPLRFSSNKGYVPRPLVVFLRSATLIFNPKELLTDPAKRGKNVLPVPVYCKYRKRKNAFCSNRENYFFCIVWMVCRCRPESKKKKVYVQIYNIPVIHDFGIYRTQICNQPIRSQVYCPDILRYQVTELNAKF